VHRQLLGEEPRDGHLPALVVLRRAEHRVAVDVENGLCDQRPPAQQVEVAHPQRRHLPVAHAGVGQEQDGQPVPAGGRGEGVNLRVGEKDLLAAHGQGQDQRQHAVGVAHG
jgi:hypothetical protein